MIRRACFGSWLSSGALLVCALLGVSVTADAQSTSPSGLPTRTVDARAVGDVPHIGFDARFFVDRSVRQKLKSGLPQTIVVRVVAHREDRDQPVGFSAQSCRVLYDLWQGSYRVQLDLPGQSLDMSFTELDDVIERCLQVSELPVPARIGVDLSGQRVYYAVAVELNPLSQDTVRRIRRWLSRPAGGQLGGDAFFGSFVSIFVGRQIGTADKAFMFRSRVWVVPK